MNHGDDHHGRGDTRLDATDAHVLQHPAIHVEFRVIAWCHAPALVQEFLQEGPVKQNLQIVVADGQYDDEPLHELVFHIHILKVMGAEGRVVY